MLSYAHTLKIYEKKSRIFNYLLKEGTPHGNS